MCSRPGRATPWAAPCWRPCRAGRVHSAAASWPLTVAWKTYRRTLRIVLRGNRTCGAFPHGAGRDHVLVAANLGWQCFCRVEPCSTAGAQVRKAVEHGSTLQEQVVAFGPARFICEHSVIAVRRRKHPTSWDAIRPEVACLQCFGCAAERATVPCCSRGGRSKGV